MQSSACQNSGRTLSPAPQANCKPAPWSIWQMAYPSHYKKKMSNCMRKQFKANPVAYHQGWTIYSIDMGISWWYTFNHERLNYQHIFGRGSGTGVESDLVRPQSSFQMKPQKIQCGLAKTCCTEDRAEPSLGIVQVSTNIVWRLNSQTGNTRSD